ncbi:MAG TPA: lipoprotein-releasing system ATP-binding protein LolD [Spirochaetia bacterium]|nr:MAG: ABC transporter [Spirochaetes bacterium GWB1_36_13]HCL56688.1 lipoprotein-releasing system ATP-binding protein LolD [Spirochaetia bacterium]
MKTTVKAKGLQKYYQLGKVQVEALKQVDMEILEGELVSIIGPSGSGKTSLLNIIGLIDTPSGGNLYFEDQKMVFSDFNDMAPIRNEKIGYIFQNFNLIPVLNVYENIEIPFLIRKNISKKEKHERIETVIEQVGLSKYKNHKPDQLSGGQRQRIAIARAIVHHPKLILADEPTANLDSHTSQTIMELLMKLNADMKTTIIFSTHDPLVMSYAKKILKIKDGVLTEDE